MPQVNRLRFFPERRKMTYYSTEEIIEARKMDLLTYLRTYEPGELVRVSGNIYSVRDHDSLKISNGKWMWWSQGIGGTSALDYIIKVRGIPFAKAVETILNKTESTNDSSLCVKEKEHGKILLPVRNEFCYRVESYLAARGIHPDLINQCIEKGLVYESLPFHNCVFLGYDENRIPRYAFFRSTDEKRIMGEAAGSDKRFSFRIDHPGSTVHVFESAIDLLSFATIERMRTGEFPNDSMLSLGGVFTFGDRTRKGKVPVGLERKLEMSPEMKKIVLHFDNDAVGKGSAERLVQTLKSSYDIHYEPPGYGKDVNDELLFLLHQ